MSYDQTTKNYGLPQWKANDKPERRDFNEAFEMIDAQLCDKVNQDGSTEMTGNLKFPHNSGVMSDGNLGIAGSSVTIHNASYFGPATVLDNNCDLGHSRGRFKNIYATTGTISTSDEREKNNVKNLDMNEFFSFFMSLRPVSFRYNNGTSGRTHHGLIAQEVEQAMEDNNLDSTDFAGLIKSPVYENEDGSGAIKDYTYGLRYTEFIPILIATVQQQQKEIKKLKKKLAQMKK